MSGTGDHRDSPGAGAAAKAGHDEQHVRVADGVHHLVQGLFSRFPADDRIGPGSETLRAVQAQTDSNRTGGTPKGLKIGVARHERHTFELAFDHVIDGVASAAAYTDDRDPRLKVKVLGDTEADWHGDLRMRSDTTSALG